GIYAGVEPREPGTEEATVRASPDREAGVRGGDAAPDWHCRSRPAGDARAPGCQRSGRERSETRDDRRQASATAGAKWRGCAPAGEVRGGTVRTQAEHGVESG